MTPDGIPCPAKITATLSPAFPPTVLVDVPEMEDVLDPVDETEVNREPEDPAEEPEVNPEDPVVEPEDDVEPVDDPMEADVNLDPVVLVDPEEKLDSADESDVEVVPKVNLEPALPEELPEAALAASDDVWKAAWPRVTPAGRPWPARITATLSPTFPA